MGSLLAVRPDTTPESLGVKTAVGKKLFHALQDYGAYVVDDAAWDCHYLCAEAGVREEVERETGLKLKGQRGDLVADVNALFAALHVVDNNAPVSVGGGGTPRAAKTPPLPATPTPIPTDEKSAAAAKPAIVVYPRNGTMIDGTDTPAGWDGKWEGQGKLAVTRDEKTFKAGPAALSVATAGGWANGQASQTRDGNSGEVARFAGHLKSSGRVTATAGVMAHSKDWKGLAFLAIGQSKNDDGWHPFGGEVTLPANTAHFAFAVLVEGEGTVWLDEVAGDDAGYKALAEAAKKAPPRKPAGPPADAPPKAPNAWTAGEGFYPDYPKAWRAVHDGFVARTKKGHIDLVFYGDSITQGWGGQKDLWAKYYAPRKAVNYGVGGDCTPQVLWRLDHGEVDGISPKAVVLMIGTNNRWRGDATPETVSKGIEAVVAKLREKLPKTKVLLLGVFPTQPKPDHPDRKLFAETNKRISKLADGNAVVFLDLTDKFLEPSGASRRR